jgi:hypothetical protein
MVVTWTSLYTSCLLNLKLFCIQNRRIHQDNLHRRQHYCESLDFVGQTFNLKDQCTKKNTTRSIYPLLSPSSQKTPQEIVKTIFIIGIPLIALMLIRQKIFGTWHIYIVENVPGLTAQKPSKWLNFRSERNKEHRHIYSAFTYRLDNSDSYNSLFSLFLYARVGTCSIVFPRNIITIRVEKPHEHKPCSAC